jgi:rsbT co-antagonist protein RsbR
MQSDTVRILQNQRNDILEKWIAQQIEEDTLREGQSGDGDIRGQSEEFLDALLESLRGQSLDNLSAATLEPASDQLAGISITRARQGFSPRETAQYVFSLKEAVLNTLQREIQDPVLLYAQSQKVSRLMDSLTITTFETFLKGREEVILRQMDEITEISNPVIRVWDGVLALPIIGTLDSSRTQAVMESLLQEIVHTGSSITILDISGVPAVDSLVAQHLIKTVSATRLMGAECIISGIRPEIAQTIVHLGIDLSGILTKATLASALKAAFQMLRLEVVKKPNGNHPN